MPIISVKLIRGRSAAQKQALIRELAEGAMRALGAPEPSIRVVLTEVDAENWGVGARSKVEIDRERG